MMRYLFIVALLFFSEAYAAGTVAPSFSGGASSVLSYDSTYNTCAAGSGISCVGKSPSQCFSESGPQPPEYDVSQVILSEPANGTVTISGQCKRYDTNFVSIWGTITDMASSCPAHSTGTTTCTCDTGYMPDSGATSCIPNTCTDKVGEPAGSLSGDGSTVPGQVCLDGCTVAVSAGATNGSVFVVKGDYTGQSCQGSESPASSIPEPLPDPCPTGKVSVGGSCVSIADYQDPSLGGLSINDIQNIINKQAIADAAARKAADTSAAPTAYIPPTTAIDPAGVKTAAKDSGKAYKDAAATGGAGADGRAISEAIGTQTGVLVGKFDGLISAVQKGFSDLTASVTAGSFVSYCADAANEDMLVCMGVDPTAAPAADVLQTDTIDISTFAFDAFSFSGAAGCPAPRTLPLSTGPVVFDTTPLCDFLGYFRLAILAVAFFVGGMIIAGQRTTDTGA